MRISLENLEAFVTAVNAGSFTAAARRLGKAQSRISTAIGNLEIDLGVTLFDRSGKFPVLTPEGEALLLESRRIINRCRELADHADSMAGGVEPRLKLAVGEMIPREVLTDVLTEFSAIFPKTEIELLVGTMNDISDMIENGRADLGIEVPIGRPGDHCDRQLVGRITLITVAAPTHPLSALTRVNESDLEQHLQLVSKNRKGGSMADVILSGRRNWYFENPRIVRRLVINGVGWALLGEHMARADIAEGRLVELPVGFGRGRFTCNIYVIWEKGRSLLKGGAWLADAFSRALSGDAP